MDTQDKQTNNIFTQSILAMCFWNGHTWQTDKQHIHSKHSTHAFLEWTHRTNGQTTYSLKVFYPCLFRMDPWGVFVRACFGPKSWAWVCHVGPPLFSHVYTRASCWASLSFVWTTWVLILAQKRLRMVNKAENCLWVVIWAQSVCECWIWLKSVYSRWTRLKSFYRRWIKFNSVGPLAQFSPSAIVECLALTNFGLWS